MFDLGPLGVGLGICLRNPLLGLSVEPWVTLAQGEEARGELGEGGGVGCRLEFFEFFFRGEVKNRIKLTSFALSLLYYLSSFFTYLFDRRDGKPQRLGLLRRAAQLVRGEGEARGAGCSRGEAGGEGL